MIVPGILRKTKQEVYNDINRVTCCDESIDVKGFEFNKYNKIQIDLCDGIYVESLTWLPNSEDCLPYWQDVDYEFDLMVQDKTKHILVAAELGVERVIIHSDNFNEILESIKTANDLDLRVGLCASIDNIKNFIDKIDYIQIMGIKNIGKQGQEIKSNLLKELEEVLVLVDNFNSKKVKDQKLYIQIDGGVNLNTISMFTDFYKKSLTLGVDVKFVVGSALFGNFNQNLKENNCVIDKILELEEAILK